MSDPALSFTLTGRGKIELLAESRGIAWIVQMSKDGSVLLLRNWKEVPEFPTTPLTKKLMAATKDIHQEAVSYLIKCWEKGGPLDDEEGRKIWWKLKEKVESY
jgi:hypothetical protein